MIRKFNIFLILISVSILALFSMKAILWTLLQWGAKFALPLALVLILIYGGSFYLVQQIEVIKLPKSVLIWIWTIGFIEIIIMGGLYHLTPQFFPSFLGDFFFNLIQQSLIGISLIIFLGVFFFPFFRFCCRRIEFKFKIFPVLSAQLLAGNNFFYFVFSI